MKNLFLTAALLCTLCARPAVVGSWKAYMAYSDVTDIVAAGNLLYVLASNDLYVYNKNDQSIQTFDKVNALTDCNITHIAYSQQARRLVIIYSNQNIDLMDNDGSVTNMSDIYMHSMTEDKTINDVTVSGQLAYISTNFGAVVLNVSRAEVKETYNLGLQVKKTAVDNECVYVMTKQNKVWKGEKKKNLIDPNNWTETADYAPDLFTDNREDYSKHIELVKTLSPGGPKKNHFYEIKYLHNRLYATGGLFLSGMADADRPGCVQMMKENDEWLTFEDRIDTLTGYDYRDMNTLDADPTDPDHVFAGGRCGLYEFQNGRLVKYYNTENSPLGGAVTDNGQTLGNSYTLINGLKFDSEGNLWILNSQSSTASLLRIKKGTTTMEKMTNRELFNENVSFRNMSKVFIDSRGLFWFVANFYDDSALFCMKAEGDNVSVTKYMNPVVNQDGTAYNHAYFHHVSEDLEGNIWLCTHLGPFMIPASQIGQQTLTYEQVKVPRNDGSNYADYLLSDVDISCMAVDGAGRKWFGTEGSGAYLISADNMTELQHFTKENSDLINNNIYSITINGKTGEVFFATDDGLCSYMSDATDATHIDEATDKNKVYAYPNPATRDYTGRICVAGLTLNAEVMIVSATGVLVAKGRSNGGLFTWDGRDLQGKRVATGVYNIISSTSEGKKGTVCKIAIVK